MTMPQISKVADYSFPWLKPYLKKYVLNDNTKLYPKIMLCGREIYMYHNLELWHALFSG